MSYLVKLRPNDRIEKIENCFADILQRNCDVHIVTSDGIIVETHKTLLCLFSVTLRDFLDSLDKEVQIVSVPFKHDVIKSLLDILTNGSTELENKGRVTDVSSCGECLGLKFANLHFERKDHTEQKDVNSEDSKEDW